VQIFQWLVLTNAVLVAETDHPHPGPHRLEPALRTGAHHPRFDEVRFHLFQPSEIKFPCDSILNACQSDASTELTDVATGSCTGRRSPAAPAASTPFWAVLNTGLIVAEHHVELAASGHVRYSVDREIRLFSTGA